MSAGSEQRHPLPRTRARRRIWRRINKKGTGSYTIDLEWVVNTGPIKLVLYKDGEHVEDRFEEHSIEGMRAALAYAKQLLE